ncbi:MAG: lytic murein transglycosylase [Piscinibacter sp.]|nr:lytic murein transglycosylase [Piscinibacter sp.]
MEGTSCGPRWIGRGLVALTAAVALAGCAAQPVPAVATTPPAPAASAATPGPEAAFADWVAGFRASARAAGIRDDVLHAAFDGVQYLPGVIERDRAQAEFTRTVWDYLERAVTPARIARGRDLLAEWREPAEAAAARFGVPAPVVVAIWGMESNYGGHTGDIPTIDALATLGFEGRRAEWARGQLLAALNILQAGDIERGAMIGSWAGAMGQTQFLPSSFLAYAVDADGDGRRDIWGSLPDVLASTAHFLARVGWQPGQPWGVEVRLPPGFDLERADDGVRQSAAQWAAEGVQSRDGAPLPELGEASVLLPAGARGPAFLTGANFRAILRYNRSNSYALAVGLLAQRLVDGPDVQASWPRDLVALSRDQLRALQEALNARGYDAGTVDGLLGPATRRALRRHQRSLGVPPDGYPTLELLQGLQPPEAASPPASAASGQP